MRAELRDVAPQITPAPLYIVDVGIRAASFSSFSSSSRTSRTLDSGPSDPTDSVGEVSTSSRLWVATKAGIDVGVCLGAFTILGFIFFLL
jgi:hypothetical protein